MKIIFIGGRDYNQSDGIANYMFNLASHLVKMGHEPIVYCESDRNKIEFINGFKIIRQKSFKSAALTKIYLGLKATIRSLFIYKDAKIFHYNGWGPSLLSSWIPVALGKRSILQGHGLEWRRTKYAPYQRRIMKVMEWVTAKSNRNWTMVSQEQTDYFLAKYNRKCVTIKCGVNLPSGKQIKSNIMEKYNLQADGYFLYLGRLVQEKNPDLLIKAFKKRSINNKKLVIAGGNESNVKYVKYLHELANGNSNIVFTNAVYGNDKEELIRNCFIYCIPSTLEGLPIALLEAMSYSKICLASNIAAHKEALGESGVWVEYESEDSLASQLAYTIENYSNIEWQKQYNYQRVKKYFTWGKIAKEYSNYIEIIAAVD
jgi:glycosyltransferase involved in cell wall biosynthesis